MNNKQTALITRPEADALITAGQLSDLGLDAAIEPMLTIEYEANIKSQLENYKHINDCYTIVTSKNAIRAVDEIDIIKKRRLILIGDSTYEVARNLGFTDIINAGSCVEQIYDYVNCNIKTDTNLLYLSGAHVIGDLQKSLADKFYNIDKIITYNAVASKSISKQVLCKIKSGKINIILFYSPRTAKIFCDLVSKHQIEEYLKNTNVFCLSRQIAESVDRNLFKTVNISPSVSNNSLLDALIKFIVPSLSNKLKGW